MRHACVHAHLAGLEDGLPHAGIGERPVPVGLDPSLEDAEAPRAHKHLVILLLQGIYRIERAQRNVRYRSCCPYTTIFLWGHRLVGLIQIK